MLHITTDNNDQLPLVKYVAIDNNDQVATGNDEPLVINTHINVVSANDIIRSSTIN